MNNKIISSIILLTIIIFAGNVQAQEPEIIGWTQTGSSPNACGYPDDPFPNESYYVKCVFIAPVLNHQNYNETEWSIEIDIHNPFNDYPHAYISGLGDEIEGTFSAATNPTNYTPNTLLEIYDLEGGTTVTYRTVIGGSVYSSKTFFIPFDQVYW